MSLPRFAAFARWLAGGALIFAPWAFGATEPWALRTLEVVVGAALGFALLGGWRKLFAGQRWWWPAAALAVYLTVQALNASHQFLPADQSLAVRPHIAWLPRSAVANATWETLGKFLMYVALAGVIQACFPHRAQRKWLLTALVVSGFVLAVVGLAQHGAGVRRLLWVRTPQPHSDYFASFVNPNNYAAYANLLIPVALALGRNSQRHSAARTGSHPGVLFYFIAAVLIATVVIAKSRVGVIVCAGVVAGWVWQERRTGGDARQALWLAAGLLVLAVALIGLVGLGPLPDKLRSWDMGLRSWRELRVTAYGATLAMFADRWLFGVGAGAFQFVFPYYQPAELTGFWRYAHSDWLQYLAELGVVGFALLAKMGVMLVRTRASGPRSALSIACGLALAGVGAHALVDFPLHVPAIGCHAVVFAVLVSGR